MKIVMTNNKVPAMLLAAAVFAFSPALQAAEPDLMATPVLPDVAAPAMPSAPVEPTVTSVESAPSTAPNEKGSLLSPVAEPSAIPPLPLPVPQGVAVTVPPAKEAPKKDANEQIEGIIKKLQDGTSGASLEDMNQARAALAKLDLLVSIETKMNDLDKVRASRGGIGMSSMIPASALGMRGSQQGDESTPSFGSRQPVRASYDVSRIVGTDGSYTAVINVGAGRMNTVRVGDQLPDGSEVRSITASGVKVKSTNGRERTLRVSASSMPATTNSGRP
jgi:type IV pilus biogenesis protein PilP